MPTLLNVFINYSSSMEEFLGFLKKTCVDSQGKGKLTRLPDKIGSIGLGGKGGWKRKRKREEKEEENLREQDS